MLARVKNDIRLIDSKVPYAGYRDTIHRGEVNIKAYPDRVIFGFHSIPIDIVKKWIEQEMITIHTEGEETMSNLPAVQQDDNLSIERLKGQVNLIQHVMREVMHKDEHYGVIPGCQKPSLLKPGAEKLSLTFRLAPSYDWSEKEMPNGHREYIMRCVLKHIESGKVFGEGVGSCTTMEAKYRFRKAEQKCPECGKETIIKGKKEYGGGWLCFGKKGGCGAKFKDGDERIENQEMGRIEHDNPADYYNTVIKMAKKRAHVDAVLTATAASDIFTQDVEDMVENGTVKVQENNIQDEGRENPVPPPQTPTPPPKKAEAPPKQEPSDDVPESWMQDQPEGNQVVFIPDKVSKKSGTRNGKEWTRYGILSGDTWYNTFNTEFGDLAESAVEYRFQIRVWYKESKFGRDVEMLEQVIREPGEEG